MKLKLVFFIIIIILIGLIFTNIKCISMKRDKIMSHGLFKSFYYFERDNSTIVKFNKNGKEKKISLDKILGEIDILDRVNFYLLCVTENEEKIYLSTKFHPNNSIFLYDTKINKLYKLIDVNGTSLFIGLSKNERYLIYNSNSELYFYDTKKDRIIERDQLEEEIIQIDKDQNEFIVFKDGRVIYLNDLKNFGKIMYLPIMYSTKDLILTTKSGYLKVNSYNYKTGEKNIFLKKGRFHCLIGIVKDRYLLYYQNPFLNIGEDFPMYCYDLKTNKYFNFQIHSKNSGWYLIP